jgi:hypothetical protein
MNDVPKASLRAKSAVICEKITLRPGGFARKKFAGKLFWRV